MKAYLLNLCRINFFLSLICCSYQAQSAAVLVNDDRSVGADFFIQDLVNGTDETPPIPFESFFGLAGALLGEADGDPFGWGASAYSGQNSSASPTSFLGNLEAMASIDDPNNLLDVFADMGDSESHYGIRFELLTPHSYNLTGDFSVESVGTTGQAASLTLGSISLSESDSPYAISGILQPGTYELIVEASVFVSPNDSGHVFANFNLQLSEVPEPVSVWLFGSGVIGLFCISKRFF